jgi:hypothetical protein
MSNQDSQGVNPNESSTDDKDLRADGGDVMGGGGV